MQRYLGHLTNHQNLKIRQIETKNETVASIATNKRRRWNSSHARVHLFFKYKMISSFTYLKKK